MATQLAEQAEETPLITESDDDGAPRDFEAEARLHGWTPKDDFKGDPSRWVDAETFVTRADEVMPLLKKKTQHQDREIAELKRTVKRLAKAEQAAYDNALADLRAKAEAAVESGDLAAFRKVDGQIETLRKEAEADADPTHGEDPQEAYEAFRETNAWYDKANLASASEMEVDARLFADRLADKYVKQGLQQEVAPTEFFARIASETEAKYPLLKARRTREKPPSAVEGVTPGNGSRNAKTGANLPAEAKEHAERYLRMGIYKDCKTKAEAYDRFAKDYTWN